MNTPKTTTKTLSRMFLCAFFPSSDTFWMSSDCHQTVPCLLSRMKSANELCTMCACHHSRSLLLWHMKYDCRLHFVCMQQNGWKVAEKPWQTLAQQIAEMYANDRLVSNRLFNAFPLFSQFSISAESRYFSHCFVDKCVCVCVCACAVVVGVAGWWGILSSTFVVSCKMRASNQAHCLAWVRFSQERMCARERVCPSVILLGRTLFPVNFECPRLVPLVCVALSVNSFLFLIVALLLLFVALQLKWQRVWSGTQYECGLTGCSCSFTSLHI